MRANSRRSFFWRWVWCAGVVGALPGGCAQPSGPAPQHAETRVDGTPTENIALPSLEGVTALQEGPELAARLDGRVAVLDLWATWCEPCRESIPKVVRLAEGYGGNGSDGAAVVVAGIHVGAGVETARRYADEAGITYPLFADPDFAFSDRVGSRSVPLLLVVDRSGHIVHRTPELDAKTLAIIRELVAAP